eukprot:53759-Hanusia_phi.AAC.1
MSGKSETQISEAALLLSKSIFSSHHRVNCLSFLYPPPLVRPCCPPRQSPPNASKDSGRTCERWEEDVAVAVLHTLTKLNPALVSTSFESALKIIREFAAAIKEEGQGIPLLSRHGSDLALESFHSIPEFTEGLMLPVLGFLSLPLSEIPDGTRMCGKVTGKGRRGESEGRGDEQ